MICRSRRLKVVCVDDFVICYFSSTHVIKIASSLAAPKPRRRRVSTGNRRAPSNVSTPHWGGRRHVTVEAFDGQERATESPRAGLCRVRDAALRTQRLVRDLPAAD